MKVSFWLFPVVGAICLLLSAWAWFGVITESFSWTTTFPAVINGLFIMLGVAISVAVDTFLLARRKPREVRPAELILLIVLVLLVGATLWLGFYDDASWVALYTWPAIILVAIATTIVIAIGNARTHEPVPGIEPVRAAAGDQLAVSTTGPSSVTATVCSKCAAREPSALRRVQPSGSNTILSVPSMNHGSIANTSPGRSRNPRPARPSLAMWGRRA